MASRLSSFNAATEYQVRALASTGEKTGSILQLPERPKRPMSAYNIFFKDERQKLADTKDINGFSNLARTIGAKWKSLDLESREYYEELGRQALAAHKKKLAKWKKLAKMAEKQMQQARSSKAQTSTSAPAGTSTQTPFQREVTDVSIVSFQTTTKKQSSSPEGDPSYSFDAESTSDLLKGLIGNNSDNSDDFDSMFFPAPLNEAKDIGITSGARYALQSNLGVLSDRLGADNVDYFVGLFDQ